MAVFGDSLDIWAERLKGLLPEDGQRRDWSLDVAVHLGLALVALRKLQAGGVDTGFANRKLIEPALDTAWRELLFIRFRKIDPEKLLEDFQRIVTLTRLGRVVDGSDVILSTTFERWYRDLNIMNSKPRQARSKRRRRKTLDEK